VSSVTIAISVGAVTGEVGKHAGTTLELGVSGVDTCVDDVHTGTGTGTAVVGVGGSSCLAVLVGDTRQTPGGGRLSNVGLLLEVLELAKVGLDDSILLNVVDLHKLACKS
jgi:hypothetical protein